MLDTKRITGAHSLLYLRNIDVQWDHVNTRELPTMDIPPSEYDRYTVKAGDLLVCEGGEVGRCAIWSDELAVCGFQKALHRLRPRDLSWDVPRFMYYAFTAAVQSNAFDDGHQSTIAHLTGDKIRAHRFAFPPPSEQAAIVRFLDHADRRIRRYIRAKEKLIALLEEQKQVIVHEAVTGRIDVRTGQPYPAYKPSGVECLGDVPAHWDITSLGATCQSIQTGPFGSQLHASDYVRNGIPVINPSNIRNELICADDQITISNRMALKLSRHKVQSGDIVLARRGEIGRCALVSDEESGWLCGTGSIRVRPKSDILSPPIFFCS